MGYDAGNSLDFYQYENFARQYCLDIKEILQRIVVSRAFTVYQLADLIINELPKVIKQFDTRLVVISDLLHISTAIRKISIVVIVTKTNFRSDFLVHQSSYNDILLSRLDKHIEITFSNGDIVPH